MKKLFILVVSAAFLLPISIEATASESISITMSANYETEVTATARFSHGRTSRKVTVVCDENGTPLYVMDKGNRRSVRFNGTDWEFTDGNLVFHFTV